MPMLSRPGQDYQLVGTGSPGSPSRHSTAMLIPISTYMRPNAGSGGTIGWILVVKPLCGPYRAGVGLGESVIVLERRWAKSLTLFFIIDLLQPQLFLG